MNKSVWGEIFGSNVKQKKTVNTSPYKSCTYGGIVGADTMINANTTLGAAISFANGKLKIRDNLINSNIKTSTIVGTVYGKYDVNEKVYIRGSVSLGSTSVRNDKDIAHVITKNNSKYSTIIGGAEVASGYIHNMGNLYLIPEVGLRGSLLKGVSYKTQDNRNVKKKSSNDIDLHASLRAATSKKFGNVIISPSVFVGVTQELASKSQKVITKIGSNSNAFITKLRSSNKTLLNTGFDLMVDNGGVIETTIGYESTLAKKYASHTGTLKVKILF